MYSLNLTLNKFLLIDKHNFSFFIEQNKVLIFKVMFFKVFSKELIVD